MDRQLSLLAGGEPVVADPAPVRHRLDDRCWVDHAPGWLQGADAAFDAMAAGLRWRQGRRPMYGRLLDEPRLTATSPTGPGTAPDPVPEVADALSRRYGRPLRHLWANWYRSGDDAVAWHADRVARWERDPLVAIVSLGGPRAFLLRPMGGGRSTRFVLHPGDLLVMGGSCQHRWQHAVPRSRGGPARISLTFRVPGRGVRGESTDYRFVS